MVLIIGLREALNLEDRIIASINLMNYISRTCSTCPLTTFGVRKSECVNGAGHL